VIRSLLPHAPGDVVAFGDEGSRTAADLLADASCVARALRAMPPGEVTLACADRYLAAVALLGAWQAERPVALPPNGQDEAVRAAVRASASGVLLHDRAGAADGVDVRGLLSAGTSPEPLRAVEPGRHLVTLWTSGSTGAPQRFEKTAAQILGEALLLPGLFGIDRGARVVATVPAHHIYGLLFGVLAPLAAGGAVARGSPLHAESVAGALRDAGATHLVSSPAHLRGLLALEALPPIACAFSSGGELPAPVRRELAERLGLAVREIYGSTETGGVAWRAEAGGTWTPFPGVRVESGPDGRLAVHSPFLPADAPRPFVSGDRGEVAADGVFRLLGRVDGVVKVAGKRVSLAEVEARLLALPGVRDAAVVALPAPGGRDVELRAAVEAAGLAPAALREALREWLDPVTVPRVVRVVERLPREASGKLPRERLLAVLGADPDVLLARREAGDLPAAWFEGHFEAFPILPGVLQLTELVLRPARECWPDLGGPSRIRRLKFQRVIRPGDAVSIRVSRPGGGRTLEFEVSGPGGTCASGRLDFGGEA
jgi:acyl-coenzyme A synthetase/AMP-(fatty) acid ligase